ncbi:MAG: hypothetical protein M3541_21570 [Acidobacteriota bacterium]|nr:hypothetical protein [Acidobacteriota bacterium]
MAVEAQQREDFETFHDLAWEAYRKGRANDPELMLLVARAQSLSGRPGDALVMLERIGPAVTPPQVATDPDFARVRALPRWAEVAGRLNVDAAAATAPAPSAKEPAPSAKTTAPSASVPPAPPA